MIGNRFAGAVLSHRPLIVDVWRRCCVRQNLDLVGDGVSLVADEGVEAGPNLVVLIDLVTAWTSSLENLRKAESRLLLLGPQKMTPDLRRALVAGVDGLVTMIDSREVLSRALHGLITSGTYISNSAARVLLDDYRTGAPSVPGLTGALLSKREREVLREMVNGCTTKAIASRLGISVKTVEAHRSRHFSRLQVSSQSEAISRAHADEALLSANR